MKMEFEGEAISEAEDADPHAVELKIIISERIDFEPLPDGVVREILRDVAGDLAEKLSRFLRSVQEAMNADDVLQKLREDRH